MIIKNKQNPDTQLLYVLYEKVLYRDFINYLHGQGLVQIHQRPTGRVLEEVISTILFHDYTVKCRVVNTTVDNEHETFRVRVEMMRGEYYIWVSQRDDIPGFIGQPKIVSIPSNPKEKSPAQHHIKTMNNNEIHGRNTTNSWAENVGNEAKPKYYNWENNNILQQSPKAPTGPIFITSKPSPSQPPPTYFIKGHAPAMDKADEFDEFFQSRPPSPSTTKPPASPIIVSNLQPPSKTATVYINQMEITSQEQYQQSNNTTILQSTKQQSIVPFQKWIPSSRQQIATSFRQSSTQVIQSSLSSSSSSMQVNFQSNITPSSPVARLLAPPPILTWFTEIPRIDQQDAQNPLVSESEPSPSEASEESDGYRSDDEASSDLEEITSDVESRERLRAAMSKKRNADQLVKKTAPNSDSTNDCSLISPTLPSISPTLDTEQSVMLQNMSQSTQQSSDNENAGIIEEKLQSKDLAELLHQIQCVTAEISDTTDMTILQSNLKIFKSIMQVFEQRIRSGQSVEEATNVRRKNLGHSENVLNKLSVSTSSQIRV